jgi:mRNA interferase MazF
VAAFPQRGDVFIVDFDPTRGSEQGGKRPAVIVSNNTANEHSPVVTVAPMTRTIPKKAYPQNVHVPAGAVGPDAGTVYCGQALTISKERLGNYMGKLEGALMAQVDDGLRAHLDI